MPIRRVIILVFAFSGFCAAVAAILYSARLGGGRPTIGSGTALLDIIGATVIGGTSLAGGKGKVIWTLIGVVFFVLLGNTLNYMGLSAFYIDVVKGGIILLAAALDVARGRLAQRRGGAMSDAILRLEGISKAFAGIHAVRDVDLELGRGRILGLIGQNGAGKSTLMNIIGGVVRPDAGTMRIDDAPYAPRDPGDAVGQRIAFIHQELNLFTNLTIAENIFLGELPAAPDRARGADRPRRRRRDARANSSRRSTSTCRPRRRSSACRPASASWSRSPRRSSSMRASSSSTSRRHRSPIARPSASSPSSAASARPARR